MVVEISLTKNLERKKREEQLGEGPFAIPQYNLSLQSFIQIEICILNGCGDIFDENLERKKKEGRTNTRMSIYNPTIQLVGKKSGKKQKGTNTRKNK